MLREVVGVLIILALVGTSEGVQIESCHKKGTTCSSFRGRFPWLPGVLSTKMWASCPGSDKVMLDCEARDGKHCVTTGCTTKASVKNGDWCRSFLLKGSSPEYAHSINIFQETCASKSQDRTVCCQPDSVESILLGSYGVEPHEFPHQAFIISKRNNPKLPNNFTMNSCGGTIYNGKWIITAAHCVVNFQRNLNNQNPKSKKPLMFATKMPANQLEVVVGSNIPGTAPASQRFQVRTVVVHGNYTALLKNQELRIKWGEDPDVHLNDIAVLELQKEIPFKNDTMPIKIAPRDFRPEQFSDKLLIIGWGQTHNLETSEFLKKRNMGIWPDRKRCSTRYAGFDAAQHLCIESDEVYGNIAGDSGGPAICRDTLGDAVLCGVASVRLKDKLCNTRLGDRACASSVYTDVSVFSNWINKKTRNQNTRNTTFIKKPLYGIAIKTVESQVKVRSAGGKLCGGTLVSPDTVVTAAHCALDATGKARAGLSVLFNGKNYEWKSKKLLSLSGKTQLDRKNELFRRKFEMSSGNRVIEDPYFESDVAVLKLRSKVTGAKPVNMTSKRLTEATGNAHEVSWMRNLMEGLRKFPVNVLKKGNCEMRYNRISQNAFSFKLSSSDVCMVEKYSGGSSCDREVGGGVFCADKLCGVQVFRMCDYSAPRIITDISLLVPIIQKFIKS